VAKKNLTAKTVAALKPKATRTDYFDSGKGAVPGFHVRVTSAGEKTYSVLYRVHGKKLRRLTIGTTEKFTLAEARKRADDAVRDAAKGIDPAQQKIMERTAEMFGELADAYIERYAKKKRSWREDKRILDKYLTPELKHARAKDVKRAEIRKILEELAKDAPIMANRTLAVGRKMYNWAMSADLVEGNPFHGISAPAPEHQRDRVLSEKELKAVWKALEAEESVVVADAYKMRLLTAQRGGEVLGMRWDEVDVEAHWWTIPSERSKNKLPHRVWLSDPAIRILEKAKVRNEKEAERRSQRYKRLEAPSPWVFPGKRIGKHMVETKRAFKTIYSASKVKDWKGHDLRRTAASYMTSMGIPRLVVGRVLNHAEEGVTAVYDRHSYDAEKQDALNRWASKLLVVVSDLQKVKSDIHA
jgi:integrase